MLEMLPRGSLRAMSIRQLLPEEIPSPKWQICTRYAVREAFAIN